MGLFLGRHHRLICMHVYKDLIRCKSVCDVHPGIDPYSLLARSCNRWWLDFVSFTACKKSRLGLKRGKKAQCVSNRCKDLFKRKKYFGVRCTLRNRKHVLYRVSIDQHEWKFYGKTRNAVGTWTLGGCFYSFYKFSQTLRNVPITLLKHRKHVF